jgi:hypothetical protein
MFVLTAGRQKDRVPETKRPVALKEISSPRKGAVPSATHAPPFLLFGSLARDSVLVQRRGGGTPRTQGQCAGTQGTGGAHPEHRDSVLAHRGRGTLRTQGKCAGTHGEGHTQNTGTVCWYTGGGAHSEHKDSVLAHRGSTPVHRDSVVAHRGRDTSRTQGEDTPRTLGEDTPRKQGQCD